MGMVVGVTSSTTTTTTTLIFLTKHLTHNRRLIVGTANFPFRNPVPHRHLIATHSKLLTSTTTASAAASPPLPKPEEVREWVGMLDIRVGRIVKAWKHPEADSLYVEEVDIGETTTATTTTTTTTQEEDESPSPSFRLICSGLVKYIPLHLLQDRKVVVLANLKPRNMRGVKSYGMLMAASDSSHENVELLEPPESSLPGDRIWFGDDVDINVENLPDPASPNQIQKKKIWEMLQPHLKTNASCVAVLGDDVMRTSAGVVRCRTLKDANVS